MKRLSQLIAPAIYLSLLGLAGCDTPGREGRWLPGEPDAGTIFVPPIDRGHRVVFGVDACVIDRKTVRFVTEDGEEFAPPWVGCALEWSQSDSADPLSPARFSVMVLTTDAVGTVAAPGARWLSVEIARAQADESTQFPVETASPLGWTAEHGARLIYVDLDPDPTGGIEGLDGGWAQASGTLDLDVEQAELTRRVPFGDSSGALILTLDFDGVQLIGAEGRRLQMQGSLRVEGRVANPDDPDEPVLEREYQQIYSCPGGVNVGSVTLPRIGCNRQFSDWVQAQVCEAPHLLPAATDALLACCGSCVADAD